MMDRRTFIGAAAAFLGTALAAEAQPAKPRRIGFLSNGNPTTPSSQDETFLRSLRELGWIDGQNVRGRYPRAAVAVLRRSARD